MSTIDFDVNLISKIHFRPSYHDTDYVWKTDLTQPKYKKVFFGIFKMKDGVEDLPTGFYKSYLGYYGDKYYWSRVQDDEFYRCGYVIKSVGTIGGISESKEAWKQASVEVSLGYKSSVGKSFNTDEEAKAWISYLKVWSNKQFETIEHGN